MQNLTGLDGAVRQSSAIRSLISMAFLSWCSVVSEVSSWLQFLWLASVGTAMWTSSQKERFVGAPPCLRLLPDIQKRMQ